ncbi:hypothetical protein HF325_004536 [Metschnikowia pulcherrima]|uniref:Uncharacterized protein n=1 Tax=Metschnikowia pulcherrima TaxID=27326 RepID=A0A8H7LD65_9ASCO|nr:hypothetical protein HF325_004536 [Metschnikowia pulcherrima]
MAEQVGLRLAGTRLVAPAVVALRASSHYMRQASYIQAATVVFVLVSDVITVLILRERFA